MKPQHSSVMRTLLGSRPSNLSVTSTRPIFAGRGYRTSCVQQQQASQGSSYPSGDKKVPFNRLERRPNSAEKSIHELLSLKNRVTVVTGGARGIGLSLARGAAELGSDIAVLDILETPHEDFLSIENDFGVRAKYYRTNVTDQESMTRSFDQTVEDFGHIDNCITAAGIVLDKPFLETGWEESARLLNVNILGTFFAAQLAVKQIRSQKTSGSIVMIASISARAALPSQRLGIYGASKGAVKSLCQQLAVELGPAGIRVNTVSPGFIATDMTKALGVTNPELFLAFTVAAPLQRIGEREDLKTVVGYLLSDAAAYTTGSDILVTGGLHSGRL